MFANTAGGITTFGNFKQSYWQLFVTLTSENFPDDMLEITAVEPSYFFLFAVYIIVGIFFLMSVLLAVIFDNYKKRMVELQRKKVSKRLEYISQFFDYYDVDGNGWLSMRQTRKFFETVLDLDQRRPKHRKLMQQIFRIVDPDNEKKILKEYILEFFEISGFKIIAKLCKEQMELDEIVKYTASVV